MRWVAHVYLANFYESVQRASKPEVFSEAAVILKHNRVLDFNRSAEEAGVKLRASYRHAYQCCPWAFFIDYVEEDYRAAAEDILKICLQYTPVIEPVAENEFYLELAGPQQPDQVVRELTVHLVPAFATGLYIGIGQNKFLARVANMLLASRKVNSQLNVSQFYWIKQEPGPAAGKLLASLPISYLWNLEDGIKQRLGQLGFTTIGQVSSLNKELLRREFGTMAKLITYSTMGCVNFPVLALYPPKQLTEELTFCEGIADLTVLEQHLNRLAAKLYVKLEDRGEGCRRLILEVEQEHGKRTKIRSFSRPQNGLTTLQEVLKSLFRGLKPDSPVTGFKIMADDLRPLHGAQLSLFEDPKSLAGTKRDSRDKLGQLLEILGKRFTPQNFHLAKELPMSRREQLLNFWDPVRFAKGGNL